MLLPEIDHFAIFWRGCVGQFKRIKGRAFFWLGDSKAPLVPHKFQHFDGEETSFQTTVDVCEVYFSDFWTATYYADMT